MPHAPFPRTTLVIDTEVPTAPLRSRPSPTAPDLGSRDAAGDRHPGVAAIDGVVVTKAVEQRLAELFRAEATRWEAVDPSLRSLVEILADFVLGGGKRVRPLVVHLGFVGAGGDPGDARVTELGAAIELLHAFALLHDDVMDGSAMRRGRRSLHERLAVDHRDGHRLGESRRYGEGLAVLVGDLAFVYADRFVQEAPRDVREVWDELRVELTMGQFLDVDGAARGDRDPRRAAAVALYKSGRYTVERPLHLGAALAGRLDVLRSAYSAIGAPLGEAYQLRDDLLGALGDERVTGKPVGDDLREGKPTLLLAFAHARASAAQRALLSRVGRADLSRSEIEHLQEALVECGAVAAVEVEIGCRVDAALTALTSSPVTPAARDMLASLAAGAAWRDR
jgi:geranylgeranyl diphosphate synthase type I